MVRIIVVANGGPAVKGHIFRLRPFPVFRQGQIQVVVFNEFRQIPGAQVVLSLVQCVRQIQEIDALLVGHDHRLVVRHPFGDPVMAPDAFQPPDFIHILESDAVHLISAILFQQAPQPQHPFPGRPDIGRHQGQQVLFANASRHQRIRPQYPGIGGDGFRFRHGHIGGVDPRLSPDPFRGLGIGHGRIAQRIVREVDFHLGNHAFVVPGLVLRPDHDELLGGKLSGRRILVPGHHGGSVNSCILSY